MTEVNQGTMRFRRNKSFRQNTLALISAAILFATLVGSLMAQSSKPFYRSDSYSVWPDRVVEGRYSAHAISSTEIVSNYPVHAFATNAKVRWTLQDDISAYPALHSDAPLLDAVYNLSLSELKQNVSKEGTFDAGARWPGVWTRDVSYSTLLSLAAIDPERSKASLLRKVKRNRIVQDTGTGGSWPVSSDRVCWVIAAWEIYLVTGDRQWLQQIEVIAENTIRDDEHVVMDPDTGLARGESSFMDWREQTYPRWMEPVDIYSSEALGTNAVFYRTYRVLAAMDRELEKPTQEWDAKADRIRSAMNERMWMKDRGLYGQYLYGRVWQTLSPRSDGLGQALSVLFDVPVPAQQVEIMRSQPLMPYGIPTVYPETPNIQAYHNRSVWPFVQAFWNLAAAKEGNETALLYGLASMYRSSSLFLTNKENLVADTGSPIGTAVNSDRQLWSVAGNLAMVYRIFFGMEYATDGLHLHPVIPEKLRGTRTLTNFHYRGAILSFTVKGFGSRVRRMEIDDRTASTTIPPSLTGSHRVVIEMDDVLRPTQPLHMVGTLIAPATPSPEFRGDKIIWDSVEGASKYRIYNNGQLLNSTSSTSFAVVDKAGLMQYQVAAVSGAGVMSFLSAPVITSGAPLVFPATRTNPQGPETFVIVEQSGTTGMSVDGNLPYAGRYILTFRYANGSGPINTNNMCAVRTLFVDGKQIGPVVLPQRGRNKWNDWGSSNGQTVSLSAGTHRFELRLLPQDMNMSGEINRALIASVSLTPID